MRSSLCEKNSIFIFIYKRFYASHLNIASQEVKKASSLFNQGKKIQRDSSLSLDQSHTLLKEQCRNKKAQDEDTSLSLRMSCKPFPCLVHLRKLIQRAQHWFYWKHSLRLLQSTNSREQSKWPRTQKSNAFSRVGNSYALNNLCKTWK